MTDDEINKAIAEACGIVGKDQWGPLYRTKDGVVRNCPDYCKDLNAMHEAIRIFDYEQCEEFEEHLCDICERANDEAENPAPWRFAVVHATARQRAEAFLRTINLWKP